MLNSESTSSSQVIFAKKLVLAEAIVENHYLLIENGKIKAISEQPFPGLEAKEFQGYVAPGFIDVHIHGRAGADVMDGTNEALDTVCKALPKTGVTAYLATTVSAPWDVTVDSLAKIAKYIKSPLDAQGKPKKCAEILGIFAEGPFFTEKHRGSHPVAFLQDPTPEKCQQMIDVCDGYLKRVAIAPDRNLAMDATEFFVSKGVQVCIAHTNATFEQCTEAYHKGADCGVHLFNGMTGLHHRLPGCVGASLYHDMFIELIADGIHVHPVVLNLAYRLKGFEKTMLITDCMRAGGLPDGEYTLGIQTVKVEDGMAKTFDGSLAGSTCALDTAFRNMINLAGVGIYEAVQMVTLVPALYLGVEDRIGSIAVGKDADLVFLNDKLDVEATMLKGEFFVA